MSCEICTLDTSVDSIMWTCMGCPRVFHPTCIGFVQTVQSQTRGSLRKKEKKPVTSYILPCCEACQKYVEANLEFHRLSEQQKQFTETLHANTQVIHQFTLQQSKPSIVNEAFEGLEVLLTTIKHELAAINKTSSLAGSVVAIKNHVTSVFDSAIQATNDRISKSLETVTSELAADLGNINAEICQLNQLALEAAASSAMTTNPMLELNILDELKSLSAQIMTSRNPEPSPEPSDPYTSLEDEINNADGWRLLGTRKVWRADWSQYDERKNRRINQQKMADKAKKRRKQNKSRNHTNNNNKNNNNYSSVSNNHRYHNNSNFGNNNSNGNGPQRIFNNNTVSNNFSSYRNPLPSDRELLAAAKDRFSQPTNNYRPTIQFQRDAILNPYQASGTTHRTIQFQRGETLNPYPADGELPRPTPGSQPNCLPTGCSSCSAASCEACCVQHTCFRRH